MVNLVSLDEVFAIAVQIEDNAGKFYRKADELHGAETGVFSKLAAMEDGHKAKFENMRSAAPTGGAKELQAEGAMYLEAIASGYRVEGSPTATAALTAADSVADILRTGTELEKQAILFYEGLKKVVADEPTQQALDGIIEQEREHLVALMAELKKSGA
ncbi:hypothetical protein PDESU_05592 [Pontiella desulfatans]|uniref:Uncharacterized protein n=1 Tax=Pontiella desulfatans TaxID=2750659 RepID=A0A6C2UA74_PONDE|nr:ferritin family protein [Pontiella desulfatans]VGO16998.1 hypothetical protein PDESU_05592 [Pontiella desulfatans]